MSDDLPPIDSDLLDEPAPQRTVPGHYGGEDIEIAVPEEAVLAPVAGLHFHPRNPRQGDVGAVVESIRYNGFFTAITVQADTGVVLAGNHRLRAALQLGMREIPVLRVNLSEPDQLRVLLADNRTSDLATYDSEELTSLLQDLSAIYPDLEGTGYDPESLDELLRSMSDSGGGEGESGGDEEGESGDGDGPASAGSLQDRFLVPPFSVLDTRQGYWRARRRMWMRLGLQSELGRKVKTFGKGSEAPPSYTLKNAMREQLGREPTWDEVRAEAERRGMTQHTGMSVFDPVLTELNYLWFCPPGGVVLDPFAGGSVRGVLASALNLQYVGVELRGEQVEANRDQWADIGPRLAAIMGQDASAAMPAPAWVQGDSTELPQLAPDVRADFVFSCPPYYNLEVYSDDPRDISNMDYPAFLHAYRQIIKHSVSSLNMNRFAVFIINDVRDKRGFYVNLLRDTIQAFEDAGAHFYNEMILVNSMGSAAIRVGRQFPVSRKPARTHQNMLVFFKGDPATIQDTYPDLVIPDLDALAEPDEDQVNAVSEEQSEEQGGLAGAQDTP